MYSPPKHDWGWMITSVFIVAAVLFTVRYGSSVLQTSFVFDEQYIVVPIDNLIEQGWSIETAIDFEETKGPALIWPYAFFGELLGGSLNALRLVSVLSSIACMAMLAYIASLCGVRRKAHLAIAVGWLVLPYSLVFSEIVMGEISFILFELLAVAVYLRSLREGKNRFVAPILFCLCIAIALHSRIHVVAVVGAICVVSFLRDGLRSWPWWVAGAVAGLLRMPLLFRWEGLVSPKYQNLHGLGFRLESLSYLAAALAPFVGVFVIHAWKLRQGRKWLIGTAIFGFVLVIIAPPNLFVPETIDYANPTERFQGVVGTAIKTASNNQNVQQFLLALLAAIGLSGLLGLRIAAKEKDSTVLGAVIGITFWSMSFGWALYAFTQGFVFDRFLMVWAFLLPIVWWTQLPRALFLLQITAMLIITVRLAMVWL